MADQIYIGNFRKGQNDYFTAFNIDNDAFPTLYNFYSWRGRVKKKRGTSLLGRLQRQIESVAVPDFTINPWQFGPLALVADEGNLITGPWAVKGNASYSLEATGSIVPGSISVTVGANTYTEPAIPNGTLIGVPAGSGTINYATGDITIVGGGVGPLFGHFSYYPDLPVMGLRDFSYSGTSLQYPVLLAFDTKYSYQINQTLVSAVFFYNVTYYKQTQIPFVWHGQDYQLFWTTNYQSALWATNNVPGFHFVNATYVAGSGTTIITFTFTSGGNPYTQLIVGDVLWFNEWGGYEGILETSVTSATAAPSLNAATSVTFNVTSTVGFSPGIDVKVSGVGPGMGKLNQEPNIFPVTAVGVGTITIDLKTTYNFNNGTVTQGTLTTTSTSASTINGQTGTVSAIINAATGTYQVTFAENETVGETGIAQLLTNSISGQDGIRWYDGDPTAGDGIPANTGLGWVNFAPPLTETTVSINDKTSALYYLVGALAIVPFKDRLLFFSPYIQAADGTLPIVLKDTVIWSWNGTPYYTVDSKSNASLVPKDETADVTAYYVDQAGKGGYLSAGIAQPITTVSANEDVLLVGFGGNGRKTRFVYTGNDLQPFLFFTINSELPSSSTYSSISLDQGALDIGPYGIAMTDQQSSQRIDTDIPDAVFTIQNLNNGVLRVNAIRDFQGEFIYFTYPLNDSPWKFPTRSFLFNYRDNTWAIQYENYTAQGRYRQQQKNNWTSIGQRYGSWAGWRVPWNAPSSSALYANLIAGNPQGYVLIRDTGTSEAISGDITAIANDGNGFTQITSYNHCVQAQDPFLLTGDYLYFSNAIGNTFLNGKIGQVTRIIDADNFVVDIIFVAGTYLGLGNFTRLCQPLLQTKQFPFYWQQGRQTRLCAQKYLMDFTASGQVTVDIYLSQNPDNPWNQGPIVPDTNSINNALIYSQLLYTCPESTNLGLTPMNVNLQMPLAGSPQQQIWHRLNTSLQGDSVQIGITLNDAQMRDITLATSEVVCHGIQFTVAPGPMMA